MTPSPTAVPAPSRPPGPADLADLVRLPAVLTVPGDALVGAAAAGSPRGGRLAGPAALLYLAGMALNDWADRAVDALERPARPVPSGRVPAATARRVALALGGAGLAGAGALGGPPALARAVPLAAAAWAYDTRAKQGPAGPAVMAACRGLDVLLGSTGGSLPRALPAAAVVAAHTAVLTLVSREEARGGDASAPRRARRRTLAVAGAGAGLAVASAAGRARRAPRPGREAVVAVASLALLARYATLAGGGFARAAADPTPARLQAAVGTGVAALVPLQAGLLAGAGALPRALALAALPPLAGPLARALGGRRTVS